MAYEQDLSGGDPRSLGWTEEVVAEVLAARDRLPELFDCLFAPDAVVRMRAGDALEKVARRRPGWFVAYVDRLPDDVAAIDQPSVQWHLAQLLGEIPLDDDQRRRAVRLLRHHLENATDWIVLTCTMEAATTLALATDGDAAAPRWLVAALTRHLADPRPAVAKRASRQLARLPRPRS